MKINKIILDNIRSYKHQEIDFPHGIVLLSGEVGSGKSSILLAIDFVLFGLRSNSLPGGSLLRSETPKGYVELVFELNKNTIKLRRNLKKQQNSVIQEPGFVIINGKREDLSPIELKNKVLQILKYPKDLLTKSKSLIYRYTVYTPQEEMKQILLGDKDYRLETLRKVFGVDKYKRIRDNTIIYVNHLKSIRKELAGKIADLDEKISIKNETDNKIFEIKHKITNIDNKIKHIKDIIDEKNKEIYYVKNKIDLLINLEKQLEVISSELKNKISLRARNNEETEISLKNINDLKKEIKTEIFIDEKIVDEKEKKIEIIQNKIDEKNALIGAFKNKISHSEEIKDKIAKLDYCPICKQKVTKKHIEDVLNDESKKINEANASIKLTENEITKYSDELRSVKNDLNTLKKQISLMETHKLKKKILQEKKEYIERFRKETLNIEDNIRKLNKNKELLYEKIKNVVYVRETYDLLIDEKNELNDNYMKLEIEKASINSELNLLQTRSNEISKEIQAKEKSKREMLYWTKVQDWLLEHFINLMEVIEKKILFRIHHDFDSLFQHLFRMFMDNDLIKINLDEEFTPIIEQNGHIIDYNYLSGGEKTAAALAYRLALNQVINSLIGNIETKDLLILDEPTDGFSDTQLDRMKDVLRELKANQTILVSHESKVESFVDHVIRINKREHVSEIIK